MIERGKNIVIIKKVQNGSFFFCYSLSSISFSRSAPMGKRKGKVSKVEINYSLSSATTANFYDYE